MENLKPLDLTHFSLDVLPHGCHLVLLVTDRIVPCSRDGIQDVCVRGRSTNSSQLAAALPPELVWALCSLGIGLAAQSPRHL